MIKLKITVDWINTHPTNATRWPTYWHACPKPNGNNALLPCVTPVIIGGIHFSVLCWSYLFFDWQNLLNTVDIIRVASSAKSKLLLFDSFSS